ncbi:GreA/GreB family elongation factor [soil metagenome]
MNKAAIIEAIRSALREEYEIFQNSSKQTRAAGNDPESKSEGKYDTRSIEENYLADGLAKQALASAEAAVAYEKLELRGFDAETPLDLGALARLEFSDETLWFFLGPSGGGIEVQTEGKMVTVVTPESPLGSQLLGLKVGEKTSSTGARVLAVE